MRNVKSAARRPGMTADRRCLVCRAPLEAGDDMRCRECAPQLSPAAQIGSVVARLRRAQAKELERKINQIETDIKRVERALGLWR